MLFAPVLFPHSIGDVSRFLRATRVTLIMVDMCDSVFRPFLDNSALTDSAYHSDEDFFAGILRGFCMYYASFAILQTF